MPQAFGRRLSLSLPRRFIGDLVHFARRVPLSTMQRTMRLADVAAARAANVPRRGWCSLFLKAYALTALGRPVLRRSYIPWPRPHLYEHPHSVAAVAIERSYEGEDGVFFAHVRGPENQSLDAISAHLRRCKEEPIESIALFRRILATSRWPLPVRRLLWWLGLNTSGYRRSCHLGTFGISVLSGLGASGLDLLTPLTTGVNYGVLQPDGRLDVRLTYDHRVLDGCTAARALADVEEMLKGPILDELEHGTAGPPPDASHWEAPARSPRLRPLQSPGGSISRQARRTALATASGSCDAWALASCLATALPRRTRSTRHRQWSAWTWISR